MSEEQVGRVFENITQFVTGAADIAERCREEAENLCRSYIEDWARTLNLVTREEFEALKELLLSSQEEQKRLKEKIAHLEASRHTNNSMPSM